MMYNVIFIKAIRININLDDDCLVKNIILKKAAMQLFKN